MPETLDPRSVVDAAEQAAAAGDYASAEQLLRDAARLQEAGLGPLHPDLANTLNNLGVVCEIADKPAEAERCFRRAYAIATAVLEPDHPFVATSRTNLEDFCRARGTAVDLPSEPPSAPPIAASIGDGRGGPVVASDDRSPELTPYEESGPVASKKWTRPLAAGALIVAGLFLAFIVTAWFRSNEQVESPPATANVAPGSPATTAAPPAVEPPAASPAVEPPAAGAPKETSTRGVGPAPAATPRVAVAQLCGALSMGGSDWRCAPPALPVDPGPLFFYTRLRSPAATTVQHRWYRGDRLRQAVELTIRPNTTDGYRTYSRITVGNQSAGDWRVELRTVDGVLLHEERFVVR